MDTVVIEHVEVNDLPAAWRALLVADADARFTVRIEKEATAPVVKEEARPAFGMWSARGELADVESYVRRLRAPRFAQD